MYEDLFGSTTDQFDQLFGDTQESSQVSDQDISAIADILTTAEDEDASALTYEATGFDDVQSDQEDQEFQVDEVVSEPETSDETEQDEQGSDDEPETQQVSQAVDEVQEATEELPPLEWPEEEPEQELTPERSQTVEQVAQEARANTVCCKLSRKQFFASKKFKATEITQVAEKFAANSEFISASKRLINTKHEAVRRVNAVLASAYTYWRFMTTPFPEAGIRLLRRDRVEEFNREMSAKQVELAEAIAALESEYSALIESARVDLGNLFDIGHYPRTIGGHYEITWEYPEIEPPNWMKTTHPELYERQRQLIAARFEAAIQDTENAFAEEFAKLVDSLTEQLGKDEEGKYNKLRSSAVDGLREFIGRFGQLNFGGNESLEQMIADASSLLGGVDAKALKKNAVDRDTLRGSMERLRERMAGVIVANTGSREISLTDEE